MSFEAQRSGNERCAYCHDLIAVAPATTCPGCRTLLHDECWHVARYCPTLGCNLVAPAPVPGPISRKLGYVMLAWSVITMGTAVWFLHFKTSRFGYEPPVAPEYLLYLGLGAPGIAFFYAALTRVGRASPRVAGWTTLVLVPVTVVLLGALAKARHAEPPLRHGPEREVHEPRSVDAPSPRLLVDRAHGMSRTYGPDVAIRWLHATQTGHEGDEEQRLLGQFHQEEGRHAEALAAFERAVEIAEAEHGFVFNDWGGLIFDRNVGTTLEGGEYAGILASLKLLSQEQFRGDDYDGAVKSATMGIWIGRHQAEGGRCSEAHVAAGDGELRLLRAQALTRLRRFEEAQKDIDLARASEKQQK